MKMNDIIDERISKGLCPICGKDFGIIYRVVKLRITDSTEQLIRICKGHNVVEIKGEKDK